MMVPPNDADCVDGDFVEAVTGRRCHPHLGASHGARQDQAAGHVVAVAYPGHAAPCKLAAPVGTQSQQVGYRLAAGEHGRTKG